MNLILGVGTTPPATGNALESPADRPVLANFACIACLADPTCEFHDVARSGLSNFD